MSAPSSPPPAGSPPSGDPMPHAQYASAAPAGAPPAYAPPAGPPPPGDKQTEQPDGAPPPLPSRPSADYAASGAAAPTSAPTQVGGGPGGCAHPPPPRRAPLFAAGPAGTRGADGAEADDLYVRDPHKLVAYLVPFPAPNAGDKPPLRFLLYTPPPPPLLKPSEGDKEGMSHKVQRKWQQEVRDARQSNAKVASWKGIKGRITKGVAWATDKTTTAQLDFLTRIPQDDKPHEAGQGSRRLGEQDEARSSSTDEKAGEHEPEHEEEQTRATVHLEEMVFLYPPGLAMTPEQIRQEFVDTILRTRKKAEKDAIIATGLLPVSAALDWALIFCGWVFGGALEVDAVWAASSIRGAKMARSVTKRLNSSAAHGQAQLKLNFVPSHRAEPLAAYLLAQCIERDAARFRPANRPLVPSENTVLKAIGWQPSDQHEQHNWEDEQWEHTQVQRDLKDTMAKAAKSWDKWIDMYHKHPEKALKKG